MGEGADDGVRAVSTVRGWVRERYEAAVRSDFVRSVAETMATRIALVGVGLVTSVLIARSLGPEGRGLQATMATITALGVQFGNLGLHASNTYYVARDRKSLPTLMGNSLLVGLGAGSLLCLVGGVAMLAIPGISPLPPALVALALAAVPIGLCYLLLQNLLLGIGEVRRYNVIELVTRVGMIGLIGVLIIGRAVSVEAIAVAGLVVSMVAGVWAFEVLRPHAKGIKASYDALREQLGYGIRAYLAALFAYAVLRADILLCKYILGAGPTGQYSIAVSMADLVYMLPVVAGTIAFPRLAATEDPAERWLKAKRAAKWVGALLVCLALVSAMLARPAVRILYGEAFIPAVPAFLWLLPGIVILGVNTILMNYFASEGMPLITIWSPALASVANIGLDVTLLPRIGIVGASLASSMAYAMMLAMSIVYIRARWKRAQV
ncbi:MAG: oligosaccharide flippase family protein [Anaerosomatales bacterium]|nr:oligosaccharide flippase family protein [Anaerosomatales bacterium]